MISPTAVAKTSLCLTPALTTLAPFCAMVLPAHVGNVIPVIKETYTEPSEPCLRNLHPHAPELFGTLRNLPKPSGTNLSEPAGTYLRNLRQHRPEPFEIFRNLPGTCFRNLFTILHRNSPEPSATCPRNLHRTYTSRRRNSPEPSGTFLHNLLLRPTPAHTGALSGLTPLAYAVRG